MVEGLRLSFPTLFELTLVCCSVCAPRLTLNVHELQTWGVHNSDICM